MNGETPLRVHSQTDAHLSRYRQVHALPWEGGGSPTLGKRSQSCLGKKEMGVAVVKYSQDRTLAGQPWAKPSTFLSPSSFTGWEAHGIFVVKKLNQMR